METNIAFREYTTSTAFCLQLSRKMISLLALLSSEEFEYVKYFEIPVYAFGRNTMNSCRERGLIDYINDEERSGGYYKEFRLTQAGEYTVELLKITGLIVEKSKINIG